MSRRYIIHQLAIIQPGITNIAIKVHDYVHEPTEDNLENIDDSIHETYTVLIELQKVLLTK